jgi:putative ABC transport system permease protein
VNGVLLRPLPYDNADRLVMVSRDLASGEHTATMQAADGVELAAETDAIEAVVTFTETVVGPMNDIDTPLHVKQARVSANLFDVLGVRPHIGRTFVPEDDIPLPTDADGNLLPDPPPYASVISYGLWQRAYGGDPGALGRAFRLWGRPHVIVGVLPRDFRLLTPAEANIGTDIEVFNAHRVDYASRAREPGDDFWRMIGLLAVDATIDDARAEATVLSAKLRQRDPYARDIGLQLRLEPLHTSVTGPARGTLVVFMGAVVFVLLIACANVANLLLVRGSGRNSEIAVRTAIGAGRGRIVRLLITEAGVLATAGGALGVALAAAVIQAMKALSPAALPRVADIRLDSEVLLFTLAVAILATLVSALLPALSAARPAHASTLGVRGGAVPTRRSQRALVVGEVALSMVLLVGAGLMILTFTELQTMSLGFEPEQVITVTATQGNTSRTLEESLELERALVTEVGALPGVEAAGVVFPVPMNGVYERSAEFARAGTEEDPSAWRRAYFRTVSPEYFDTVGLALRRGRGISPVDTDIDVKTVVIDERLAARHFRGADPVGEHIRVRGMRGEAELYEIVGIVEYSPQWDHRDEQPTMYFHRVQYLSAEISIMARVAGDPALAAAMILDTVHATAPELPADLAPLSWFVDEALVPARFVLVLMTAFSAMALLLAAIGLYAVLAYTVRQQTKEIGIRMALGAQDGALVRSVVRQGTAMAVVGAGLGLVTWSIVGRLLESQLYGVGAMDPLALAATATVLIAVAALASYVPARRAARVDPAEALRSEW